jgi:alkylhydroperoxidase family enzyme
MNEQQGRAIGNLTPEGGWRKAERVRVSPLKPEEMSLFVRMVIRIINTVGKLDASNLFMMLLRNFRLFKAWLGFAARMMPYGEIDRRDTELMILRVGWNCRCRYEWGQHVDIGLRTALSEADIVQVTLGADAPDFEPRIKALMKACDEFHHERMVSVSTWAELEQHYSPRKLLEVLMLIGHYEMLAGVLNSTGLPLDHKLDKLLEKV